MTNQKKSQKKLIQFFTQYGIHIWAILIIANAVMVYTFQFSIHAAGRNNPQVHTLDISQSPSQSVQLTPSTNQPSPSTAPLGPSINLAFSVPGIGSGGGVMKPLHFKRSLTVYLFSPNVNSLDPSVKPLYTAQGSAVFDSDPNSPTYTSFISPVFDLGSSVQDGNYQIAFRTTQSLRTLIKQNTTDVGGEVFSLSQGSGTIQIPLQTVLMGDIIPSQGDNNIDINDYNAFISCYGVSYNANKFCKNGNFGDFNDDGTVDGIDYNILLRSLNTLTQQGVPAPQLSPTPLFPKKDITPRVTKAPVSVKKNKSTQTVKTSPEQTQGSNASGLMLFLFFIIFIGGAGIFLYVKNENFRNKIGALIHLSPSGEPSQSDEETTETIPAEETPANDQTQESGEKNIIEKECYVKKKSTDEEANGIWLLLTDDNGTIEAHYAKNDAADGFAKVKGVMKTENGKTFLEISELITEG